MSKQVKFAELYDGQIICTKNRGFPIKNEVHHAFDKFERGIREIFLSYQRGLWKMHRIDNKILHSEEGDFRILVKNGIYKKKFYGSFQGALWRWGRYHMHGTCISAWNTVIGQAGFGWQCRIWSDCSWRSALIRVYTVCQSVCILWMHNCKVKQLFSALRVITAIFRFIRIYYFGIPGCWWLGFDMLDKSLITRKPIFGVFDQVRLKPTCAATETS